MLKFKGSRGTKPFVGLGLSRANIEKLQKDMPIVVNGAELGIEHDIFIFAGETEKSMLDDLKKAGITADKMFVDMKAMREGS